MERRKPHRLRRHQNNKSNTLQSLTDAAQHPSSTAQMPTTPSVQPPRILPNQSIQANTHALRVNVRIHPPRDKQIDTALDTSIAIRPADSLVPVFERCPCEKRLALALMGNYGRRNGGKGVCLRNLCTALRAARSLRLRGRRRSSGGRRGGRRCRLLGGGRLRGCGCSGCTFVWDRGEGLMGEGKGEVRRRSWG